MSPQELRFRGSVQVMTRCSSSSLIEIVALLHPWSMIAATFGAGGQFRYDETVTAFREYFPLRASPCRSKQVCVIWKTVGTSRVARTLDPPELLRYRSNLLGSDLRITNFGGGNTSSKIQQVDPLSGRQEEVLWIKGSGGDLGSIKLSGLAALYSEKLQGLEHKYRGAEYEDEMVDMYPLCAFGKNSCRGFDRHSPPRVSSLPAHRPFASRLGHRPGRLRQRAGKDGRVQPRV